MATDTVIQKRDMMELFKQKAAPTMFLSSWFQTRPNWMFRSRKIVMDIKRLGENYAVDVTRFGGGVFNKNKQFTTKEYEPPYFNEYTAYTAEELEDRLPGMTEYDSAKMAYQAQLLALVTDDQIELADKIQRAKERMAAQVLLTGKVTLLNSDEIDFKFNANHAFNAATVWSNSAAKYKADLIKAANLNRKDGKVTSPVQNVLMSETSFSEFTALAETGDRNQNVNLDDIGFPTRNTEGAAFHGQVAAGSYIFNIWTYPQYYEDSSGVLQPFITDEKVIVIPDPGQIDLRTVYAGVPTIARGGRSNQIASALGLPGVPTTEVGEMLPYYKLDEEDEQLKSGVKSSFLTIPSQIDGWCVIST